MIPCFILNSLLALSLLTDAQVGPHQDSTPSGVGDYEFSEAYDVPMGVLESATPGRDVDLVCLADAACPMSFDLSTGKGHSTIETLPIDDMSMNKMGSEQDGVLFHRSGPNRRLGGAPGATSYRLVKRCLERVNYYDATTGLILSDHYQKLMKGRKSWEVSVEKGGRVRPC